MMKPLPPQVEDGELTDTLTGMSDAIKFTTAAAVGGGFATSFIMDKTLSSMFSVIHVLQLMIHLPLFSDQWPGYAMILYQNLI